MRRISDIPMKNGGWLHKTNNPIPHYVPLRKAVPERLPDLKGLWSKWFEQTDFHQIDGLAMSLGVDAESLRLIGCARSERAWAFQMKDAQGKMIGIRLRGDDGSKYAVRGSKSGLFIPTSYPFETDEQGDSDAF